MTTGLMHRGTHQAPDVGEQACVAIAEAPEQLDRALEIGQHERKLARGQLPAAAPAGR